jgi:hypothetical protein
VIAGAPFTRIVVAEKVSEQVVPMTAPETMAARLRWSLGDPSFSGIITM